MYGLQMSLWPTIRSWPWLHSQGQGLVSRTSALSSKHCAYISEGPLIGGFLSAYGGWRWTQWIILILGLGVYLFGIAMPDT